MKEKLYVVYWIERGEMKVYFSVASSALEAKQNAVGDYPATVCMIPYEVGDYTINVQIERKIF